MWKEIDWSNQSSWPLWLRAGLHMTGNNSVPYRVHLYQRIDPQSRPPYNWPYCRNVKQEAGIYLQFIYDYYYDLPEKILFIHGDPFTHSPHPIEAALCIRDDVHYASVNSFWIQDRPWIVWRRDPISQISLLYHCASRLLKLLGYDAELQLNPTKINPKDTNLISTYCCAQFYVTKQRIHHYTYEQWSKLYHVSQEPYCTAEHVPEKTGIPEEKRFGVAFEHLWHVILGLHSTNMQPSINGTNTDRCHLFRLSCAGSPC
ncbi:unnamed protein product [Rotaria sp. Silwood1]|nr:unnamed protein product [Rotaria sp. Silwood1]CAF1631096.1 unnamed protein product [Rotaria sp. Silwood1]